MISTTEEHQSANLPYSVFFVNSCSIATPILFLQKTYLIEVIRLLIESETVWECPASTDHVGGSFGLIARERAVLINKDELSNMVLADTRIGSCARDPCGQKGTRW